MAQQTITILYLVGRDAPTSIPLEVARFIHDERVRLLVVAFSGNTPDNSTQCSDSIIHLGAEWSFDLNGISDLYECIRECQPDVIHVHHTASALWGALLGKLSKGIAVVRSEHNNHQFHSVGQNVANWISELLADRILCNSQDTYRNLHSWEKWAVKGRWEKVYNGVDVGRIDRAKQRGDYLGLDESEDKIVVGSVGRFVRQKNYERLIHALPMVIREKPSVHLVLVGDGEKRRALEDLARELGLSDRVTFLGEVPRDRVYTFLHEFDLFVVPSLWEGFCNAAVEAMAAGLPIACSEIRTLQEVVGDVATYFNPESADSIARGLISLLQEGPVKWRECGQACRKRAIDNYSIERTANAYVRNYFAAVGWSMPESGLKPA